RRDLYLADTTGFNPQPLILASDPSARLPAVPITTDGGWLLYYDELRTRAEGATLNARRIGSEESLSFPNVYDAKVARDGLVVISDNRSNPDQWPVVADLKLLDLSADAGVAMIEERVIDGSAFFVGPHGDRVIYLRSGVDAEGNQDRDAQGVDMMVLPDADDSVPRPVESRRGPPKAGLFPLRGGPEAFGSPAGERLGEQKRPAEGGPFLQYDRLAHRAVSKPEGWPKAAGPS